MKKTLHYIQDIVCMKRKTCNREKKINELLYCVVRYERLPSFDEKFSDGLSMVKFWALCKNFKSCEREPYSRLLENNILNDDYNKHFTSIVQKTKIINFIADTIDKLLLWVSIYNDIPTNNGEFKNKFLTSFWKNCKNYELCYKKPYDKLLNNNILKNDYLNVF